MGAGRNKYAEYKYLGAGTVVQVDHPEVANGFTLTFDPDGDKSYGGFDRFGRIVEQLWKRTNGDALDRYTYGYDYNSNRLYRKNELSSSHSELYHANGSARNSAYDGLDLSLIHI